MLSVRELEVRYGAVRALRGVSLDVPDAGVVAVLGSNGAGKSTLLRAISGNLRSLGGSIEAGTITFDGRSLNGLPPASIVADGVVQVPEGRCIFGGLTVDENLRVGGFCRRDRVAKSKTRAHVYELFPLLHDRRHDLAGLLSGGQQQMLAIGRALMASPRLLLLDEPSLGLAPQVVSQIGRVVQAINRQGTAVLLVEQNAALALRLARDAIVLTLGEVTLTGPTVDLAADDRIRQLYLGGASELPPRGPAEPPDMLADTRRLARWAG
jgi:branched-chain amino acid transport system ATP-binding protein